MFVLKYDLSSWLILFANQSGGRESRKATLVLEQLQKKWRESSSSSEGRLLGDKLAAMETKCEQLEEKLADTRSEVNSSIRRNFFLSLEFVKCTIENSCNCIATINARYKII